MPPKDKPISKQKRRKVAPVPVAELIGKVMEPVMQRRSGMNIALMNAWGEIVGDEFSKTTKPENIVWPRRAHEDDPFEPAVLEVACESAAALFFQHETDNIKSRVNVYFGFEAIKRIKINQKPVIIEKAKEIKPQRPLNQEEVQHLKEMLDDIDDPNLRETLEKLGSSILGKSQKL